MDAPIRLALTIIPLISESAKRFLQTRIWPGPGAEVTGECLVIYRPRPMLSTFPLVVRSLPRTPLARSDLALSQLCPNRSRSFCRPVAVDTCCRLNMDIRRQLPSSQGHMQRLLSATWPRCRGYSMNNNKQWNSSGCLKRMTPQTGVSGDFVLSAAPLTAGHVSSLNLFFIFFSFTQVLRSNLQHSFLYVCHL